MKLAWAEMRVVLARLLWAFDLALKDENDRWDWGVQDTYIVWVSRHNKTRALGHVETDILQ